MELSGVDEAIAIAKRYAELIGARSRSTYARSIWRPAPFGCGANTT
jgi:hypothetical protein